MATKAPSIPASLPAMPGQNVKEFDACLKTLDAAIADMKKAVTFMKQLADSLKTVAGAASKTAGDLQKQAKDKTGAEKSKYLSAASTASGIGAQATASQRSSKVKAQTVVPGCNYPTEIRPGLR